MRDLSAFTNDRGKPYSSAQRVRDSAESGAVPLQEVYRAALDAARALPAERSG